jgi:IS5 family transposase
MMSSRERHYARRWEHHKTSIGARLEHPFGVIGRQFRLCQGAVPRPAKNTTRALTLFALPNLWMARRNCCTRQVDPPSGRGNRKKTA